VFENRVLRKIFRPKRDKVTGSGEDYMLRSFMSLLLTKYYCYDQIGIMRWAGHVAYVGERIGACQVLLGKSKGKKNTWKTWA
jgi:hypothetical protein